MIKTTVRNKGFTLAELLMAVWVISIILAAVATLSFALGSANDSVDNSSEIYARIRYTTMYLGELIRNSKLICYKWDSSVAIWRADDNGNSQIDPNEIVYIERDSSSNCLKLISFQPSGLPTGWPPSGNILDDIKNGPARTWLNANTQVNDVNLINNCSYVTFTTDRTNPPWTFSKRLNLFFGIQQKGVIQNYQIAAFLRCQAGYMLDASGLLLSSDDDM
jgi:prepilin-type N-terminal cleavage/methylation domain-containing protein